MIQRPHALKILRFIVNRPVFTILLVVFITLLFGYHLPQLSFRTSIYDLVIEDLPETNDYQQFKKTFGSDEIIRVVIKAENVFDPLTFRKIKTLADRAAHIQGVRQVISLPGVKESMDISGKWSLDEFRSMLKPAPLFERNLLSKDNRSTSLTLILDEETPRDEVIAATERMIEESPRDLTLYQIGMPLLSQALVDYSIKDFFRLPPLTLLTIFLILLILYRNLPCLILPTACVLMSLIWTLGLMAWAGAAISMLTLVAPVLIIAVGTAYCLHICSEYLRRAAQTRAPREAAFETFETIYFPTSLAVLTTLAGLASLLVNRIASIQEFALVACFGMFSLFIAVFTLFPAGLALLPLPRMRKSGTSAVDRGAGRLIDGIIRVNVRHQGKALTILALVTAFCLLGVLRLNVETNPMEFFRSDSPINQRFHDIYRDLSGSFPVYVTMDGEQDDFFEKPANIKALDEFQRFLDTLPKVDKTVSFADYLKLVNYASSEYKPEAYSIPDNDFEIRTLINNFKSMLGRDMLARFMSPSFSQASVLLLTHLSNSRDFLETRTRILDYARAHFSRDISWDVTGLGVVISASNNILTRGQVKSISLTLALVFGIMFLLFLSLKVGLVALVPNIFPIVVNFGVMGWFGVELDMGTSLVACVAIGLAVDDTIHYLFRYSREIKKDLNRNRALADTLRHVGAPIIFTTLTISAGFSILIFSQFQPTAILGIMMVITLISALIGDLIILPTLMLHVELVTVWDLLRVMRPMSRMSADTAHELNQPLNAIKMGSEFLKMMVEQKKAIPEQQIYQVAGEISDQVDRASNVIRLLGDFNPEKAFTREQVILNEPVKKVLALMAPQMALQNIRVELDLDENPPPIEAHFSRLEQIVFNLLSNARDAISEKQDSGAGSGDWAILVRTYQEGEEVVLSIADPGVGVPRYARERIFEPFYTTKSERGAAGLGLSITYGIVRDYRGHITFESKEGQGAVFKVSFPRA